MYNIYYEEKKLKEEEKKKKEKDNYIKYKQRLESKQYNIKAKYRNITYNV